MAVCLRKMLQLAAISGIAVTLSAAAMAAERAVASEAGAVKTAPSAIKHRASPGNRIAASRSGHQRFDRHGHYVVRTEARLNGADVWRGRQFVLILGVGY